MRRIASDELWERITHVLPLSFAGGLGVTLVFEKERIKHISDFMGQSNPFFYLNWLLVIAFAVVIFILWKVTHLNKGR
jgi:hypothetical protein